MRWNGRVKEMIKALTIVRPALVPDAYEKLAGLFSALGFEAGRGWELEGSRGPDRQPRPRLGGNARLGLEI